MNPKVLTVTIRAAVVVLTLILIWLLFAPKSYGQINTNRFGKLTAPTKDSLGGNDYYTTQSQALKLLNFSGQFTFAGSTPGWLLRVENFTDTTKPKTIRFNERNTEPILLKVGDLEYVLWRGKLYMSIGKID